MVIDTACQMTVAGPSWHQQHDRHLRERHNLCGVPLDHKQTFRFGDGEPRQTNLRFAFPAGISGVDIVLRVFFVLQPIVCLGSRHLTKALGMILNQVTGCVSFATIGKYDILLLLTSNGHLGIPIDEFSSQDFPTLTSGNIQDKAEITIVREPQRYQEDNMIFKKAFKLWLWIWMILMMLVQTTNCSTRFNVTYARSQWKISYSVAFVLQLRVQIATPLSLASLGLVCFVQKSML